MKEKHPVQFGKTLWELIGEATRRHNQKKKANLTCAEYVRKVTGRAAKRTIKKPTALQQTLSEMEGMGLIGQSKEAQVAAQIQRGIAAEQQHNSGDTDS